MLYPQSKQWCRRSGISTKPWHWQTCQAWVSMADTMKRKEATSKTLQKQLEIPRTPGSTGALSGQVCHTKDDVIFQVSRQSLLKSKVAVWDNNTETLLATVTVTLYSSAFSKNDTCSLSPASWFVRSFLKRLFISRRQLIWLSFYLLCVGKWKKT